jgi:hypothetical protein
VTTAYVVESSSWYAKTPLRCRPTVSANVLQIRDAVRRHRLDAELQQAISSLSCVVSVVLMSLVALAAWLQNLIPLYEAQQHVASSTVPLIYFCLGAVITVVVVANVASRISVLGQVSPGSRRDAASPAVQSATAASAEGTQATERVDAFCQRIWRQRLPTPKQMIRVRLPARSKSAVRVRRCALA